MRWRLSTHCGVAQYAGEVHVCRRRPRPCGGTPSADGLPLPPLYIAFMRRRASLLIALDFIAKERTSLLPLNIAPLPPLPPWPPLQSGSLTSRD